jgi:hypothetical protein
MVKVREMLGTRAINPRGDIEYDDKERDRYVSKFLAAFTADVDEAKRAELVFALHSEVCSNYDLYIAINDALNGVYRRALKTYVQQWKSR